MNNTSVSLKHFETLTWLRAAAALFVVISHVIRSVEEGVDLSGLAGVLGFVDLGGFGVYLFFALSGCTLYLSNAKAASAPLSFYVKRFMRIWPAFALSLLLFACFDPLYARLAAGGGWLSDSLRAGGARDLLVYASLTSNIVGPGGLFNAVYWSIPAEFQFYLLFPVTGWLMRRGALGVLAPVLLGALLYAVGRLAWLPMARYEVFTMAYVFLGGVALAHWRGRVAWMLRGRWGGALMCAMLLVVGARHSGLIGGQSFGASFYGVSALLCVFFAVAGASPAQPQSAFLRLLSRYGEVSYSIYLFHMLFVALAVLLATALGVAGVARLAFVMLATLCGSYGFSLLSYRLVEQPSIRLGRTLLAPRAPRPPAGAALPQAD